MLKLISKSIFILFVYFGVTFGGGFQINEHGARGMGMAGAFTAVALDPSAIFFNPAGLSQLKGFQIMAGATLITPKTSFRGVAPQVTETKMESQVFTPFNFYATYQLNDKFTIGLGVNNPYGLGTKWPENWVGNLITTEIELRTFYFSPTVSYKINDMLSLGVGFDYVYGDVVLKRNIDFAPFQATGKLNLKGTGSGYGFRAGILAHLTDKLSMGLTFRSNVKISFDGTAETTAPSQLSSKVPSGDVKTSITTPMNITYGIAYKILPTLLASFDFQYIGWSSYDKLRMEFVQKPELTSESPRNYENSYILRFGLEYELMKNLALRGGILYDRNPVKDEYVDPLLPDANRIGLNLGFGYKLTQNIQVDASYLFLRFNERTVTNSLVTYSGNSAFNGTYTSSAHLFGLNLTLTF